MRLLAAAKAALSGRLANARTASSRLATSDKRDGDKAMAAAKTLKWESPRGPVAIDPNTRHITQNVYLRVVEKGAGGLLINKEVQTFPAQVDHGLVK